jgi:flagellar basal-body rod protein FlgB
VEPRLLQAFWMIDGLTNSLEHYMDLLSARQKIVASNVANADTPGYRTKDLDFQAELQAACSSPPQPMEVGGLPVKNDGNDVSLDREARLLSENALRFSIATNLMRTELQSVKEAIQEGKSSS